MRNRLYIALFVALSLLLGAIALLSLRWRMVLDTPILLYLAYLMDKFGYVPYRDFFDMNLPGTYFVNLAIGKVFGYGDLGVRVADLVYLGALLASTWAWLRRLGWRAAWSACVLFGLMYLKYSTGMSLQREYLILLPLSLALGIGCGVQGIGHGVGAALRAALVGLLFGLIATIKPHAAIGLPVILAYMLWLAPRPRPISRAPSSNPHPIGRMQFAPTTTLHPIPYTLALLAGLALPILMVGIYLAANGALDGLLFIATRYWPLYGSLTDRHQTLFGAARVAYLAKGMLALGGHAPWLLPAGVGALMALFRSAFDEARKRQVWLMVGMAAAYGVYPALSGQFWDYHWLPFLYFALALASLCWVAQPRGMGWWARALPIAAMLLAMALRVRPPGEFWMQLRGQPIPPPNYGRDDQIAAYLRAHLQPGDRVQPLDWTRGGAVHAMLMTGARIATPFVYDFHFYHHISSPTIQALRRRFMQSLAAAPPRFIVDVQANNKPWVSGTDTTREFPELRRFLSERYAPAFKGDGFTIYELASSP